MNEQTINLVSSVLNGLTDVGGKVFTELVKLTVVEGYLGLFIGLLLITVLITTIIIYFKRGEHDFDSTVCYVVFGFGLSFIGFTLIYCSICSILVPEAVLIKDMLAKLGSF